MFLESFMADKKSVLFWGAEGYWEREAAAFMEEGYDVVVQPETISIGPSRDVSLVVLDPSEFDHIVMGGQPQYLCDALEQLRMGNHYPVVMLATGEEKTTRNLMEKYGIAKRSGAEANHFDGGVGYDGKTHGVDNLDYKPMLRRAQELLAGE